MAQITLDIPDEFLEELEKTGKSPTEWFNQRLPEFFNTKANSFSDLYRFILDFIASNPTPQQIADFKPTTKMQERLKDLLDRNQSGKITLAEQAELKEYERIEHIVIMLKAGNLKNFVG